MAKKKSNNEKNEDNESNVQPINSEVGEYQAGLKLYRSHPSLPTFFFLLNQAVNAGIRFELLEPELIHLIDIDDDQYFGIYGSKYFNRHYDDLNFISPFRSSDADILAVCKSLWKLLENFQTEELWGYENYLVGISDYVYLHDQKPVIDAHELPEAGEPKLKSVLSKSIKEMVAALSAEEDSAKIISDFAKQKGSPMVPWSAWVDHYLASRPGLSDRIRDLSEYFASYYVQDAESDFSEMELKVNTLKIDKGNAKALARICEFLIFNRLFKKVVYKNSNFDLQQFYRERIEHLSSRDALGDPADEAEYIIAISNLLMINAKLYVNSIEDGIVTEQELCRDFLADVTGECLDLACLTSLPSSGFEQMLVAINPYEGDRPDTYCVLEALRVVAYGMPGRWVPHLFDDMFEKAFGGIDFRLEPFLRQRIERAAKGWLIPFQHTKKIVRIFDDFWLDPYILEKISVALFKADQKNSNRCNFFLVNLMRLHSIPIF